MKKIVCLLLAVFTAGLSACAAPQSAPPKSVMLILQSWSSSFAEDVIRGANEAAKQNGLALTVKTVSSIDAAKQQADLIQTAIEQGYSAIVIDPAGAGTVGPAVLEAVKKRVPVVSVNSGIEAGQSCSVDTDKNQMALGVFSTVRRLEGKNASVLLLNCLDEYINTQSLAEVLQMKIGDFPDMDLRQIDFHIGENEKLTNDYTGCLATVTGDFTVIALNGYATVFACNRIKALSNGRKISVISFSQDKNTISMLEQNRIDAICVNRNANIGYTAVEQANLCLKGDAPQNVLIPSVFADMQNLYSSEMQQILFPLN